MGTDGSAGHGRSCFAVLFSGNGFRAIGAIAALEEDLDRPVLTANQVAFWYALRQAGVRAPACLCSAQSGAAGYGVYANCPSLSPTLAGSSP